jgi:hypothetical protein
VESAKLWNALKTTPYEIVHGKVVAPDNMTIKQLLDSTQAAFNVLNELRPSKNQEEFKHYRVMMEIRRNYLGFHDLLDQMNSPEFTAVQMPGLQVELERLVLWEDIADKHFEELNKDFLYPGEIKEENELRNIRKTALVNRYFNSK